MAKKKVKVDTEKFDMDLEKDGTNVKLDIDTKNVDVSYIKDEVKKEFKLDSKNIDIDISKTAEGLEVKVESKGGIWKLIAKRVVKFILRRFKIGK